MQVGPDPAMARIRKDPQRFHGSRTAGYRIVDYVGRRNCVLGKDFLSRPLSRDGRDVGVVPGMGMVPVKFLLGIDHDKEQRRMVVRQPGQPPGGVQSVCEAGLRH